MRTIVMSEGGSLRNVGATRDSITLTNDAINGLWRILYNYTGPQFASDFINSLKGKGVMSLTKEQLYNMLKGPMGGAIAMEIASDAFAIKPGLNIEKFDGLRTR